jgi:hypothetical protein
MRRVWMGVLIPAVLLLFAPAASAGGSWMGVTNINGTGGLSDGAWGGWAAPGATITMRGAFCDGQQADPSAGPWTAYISSGDSEMLQPLGQVTIDAAMGNGCPYVASVTFMVPETHPGPYYVHVCSDDHCTIGVGDLSGGMFTVATTALEARLLNENAALEHSVSHIDRDRDRLRAREETLEGQLQTARARIRAAEAERNDARDERQAVSSERGALASELEAARHSAEAWRWLAAGSLLTLIVSFGSVAMLAHRKRGKRVAIPDTPEELFTSADSR